MYIWTARTQASTSSGIFCWSSRLQPHIDSSLRHWRLSETRTWQKFWLISCAHREKSKGHNKFFECFETIQSLDLWFLDLAHSLDLELWMAAKELGRYIRCFLDLGHLFPSSLFRKFRIFYCKKLTFWGEGGGECVFSLGKKLTFVWVEFQNPFKASELHR